MNEWCDNMFLLRTSALPNILYRHMMTSRIKEATVNQQTPHPSSNEKESVPQFKSTTDAFTKIIAGAMRKRFGKPTVVSVETRIIDLGLNDQDQRVLIAEILQQTKNHYLFTPELRAILRSPASYTLTLNEMVHAMLNEADKVSGK